MTKKYVAEVWSGPFYTEGHIVAVAKTKKRAMQYVKDNGFTKTRDRKGLYEKVINGESHWMRVDNNSEVEFLN